jgi:hypothetical protein
VNTKPGKHHFAPDWALKQLPGELLFVPAGVVHRFEDFSDDFATWVMFYGPEGGE